jgi:hypothetical protein
MYFGSDLDLGQAGFASAELAVAGIAKIKDAASSKTALTLRLATI